MAFVRVASVDDLKDGEGKEIEANGKKIALFKIDGEFFAIDNTCPHHGGPLGEGSLEDDVVTCPWHGWRFNVKTGVSPVVPTAKVKTYEVKIEGDGVCVDV